MKNIRRRDPALIRAAMLPPEPFVRCMEVITVPNFAYLSARRMMRDFVEGKHCSSVGTPWSNHVMALAGATLIAGGAK